MGPSGVVITVKTVTWSEVNKLGCELCALFGRINFVEYRQFIDAHSHLFTADSSIPVQVVTFVSPQQSVTRG
jgi:hypothetical protein